MNRKKFIQTTGLGITAFPLMGAAMVPKPNRRDNKLFISELKEKIVRNNQGAKLNVIGDNQVHKLSGKDTNQQFTLIEEINEPGTKIPPHVHTKEDEVFHVLEGELKVTVGSNTTTLKAGDLGFLPRNIPHGWEVIGEKPCRVILSVFPAGLELMFEELSKLPEGPPDFEKVVEITGRYGIQFV